MKIIFYRDLYNPAVYGQALEGEVKDIPDDIAKQLVANHTAGLYHEHVIQAKTGMVSCIMPTKNRRQFVPRAISCFLAQSYEPRELIILDNGEPIADLVPKDSRIRYMRLNTKQTTGQLRNFCCQLSAGEFIAHWDDDDWSHPKRLEEQLAALGGKNLTGYRQILFHGPEQGDVMRYSGPPDFAVGTSLFYRRAWWMKNRFANQNVGEDWDFLKRSNGGTVITDGIARMVASTHDTNTCKRVVAGDNWKPATIAELPEEYQL